MNHNRSRGAIYRQKVQSNESLVQPFLTGLQLSHNWYGFLIFFEAIRQWRIQ